ncbi:hypothetical protein TNIN_172661 [Trichonephila inaurata madagascariensis]|uniref:Uncharacterized protein n=1 Tax=Trichonephila inaurata madagascariensis TaxID=2747483 RepID=A0A8X6XW29_9ARAC|nr:hypothetical protein TNIN_172661 [Trichonephila inaurata madagascariensis]
MSEDLSKLKKKRTADEGSPKRSFAVPELEIWKSGNEPQIKQSYKPCHYSPQQQDRTKNKSSYFPGQRKKPTPNRGQSRPHSFSTVLGKAEPRIGKCLYCKVWYGGTPRVPAPNDVQLRRELDACRSLSANEKREILRKEDTVIYV